MPDDPNNPVDPNLQAAADYAGITPGWLGTLAGIPYQHPDGRVGTFADLVPQKLPPAQNQPSFSGVSPDQFASLSSIPLQNPEGRLNTLGSMADLVPQHQTGINPSLFPDTPPKTLATLASIPYQHPNGDLATMADRLPRYSPPRWAPPRTRLIDLLGEPWKSAIEGSTR